MRKRKKLPLLTRVRYKVHSWFVQIGYVKIHMDAAYSARYILEDLNNEEGYRKMSELTGLPIGTIVAAFQNIYREH